MNLLDRAIGYFAPGRALMRARAREAFEMLRDYEAAKSGRRTANWKATGSSANTEVYGAYTRLRDRSRELVRNNPYAKRAISAIVANMVGTGIQCAVKGQPGAVWKAWTREADFYGLLDLYGIEALSARSWQESGECLLVRQRVGMSEAGASGVPLKIKVLEADYIDPTRIGPTPDGNLMVGGVEIDPQGRRVAYWLYQQHPGDSLIFRLNLRSVRVPAADVIHLFEMERPGQLRGVPKLSASIMRLRDLDDYQEAMLVKKKIEACFAAFVKTDEGNARTIGSSSTTEEPDENGNTRRIEAFSPGMIEYLKQGEDVVFGQPSSVAGETGYTTEQLHAIAIGAGVTYEQLTGDLSLVNFSSMRAGRQEFKALVEQMRWLTFIPMVCERIWGWFEEAAFQAGRVRTQGYMHAWTPPRWEYVNPLDDVKTDKEELAGGLSSLSAKIRARGDDPDEVFDEIAAERKRLKELGITVDYGIKGSGVGDVEGAGANSSATAKETSSATSSGN